MLLSYKCCRILAWGFSGLPYRRWIEDPWRVTDDVCLGSQRPHWILVLGKWQFIIHHETLKKVCLSAVCVFVYICINIYIYIQEIKHKHTINTIVIYYVNSCYSISIQKMQNIETMGRLWRASVISIEYKYEKMIMCDRSRYKIINLQRSQSIRTSVGKICKFRNHLKNSILLNSQMTFLKLTAI